MGPSPQTSAAGVVVDDGQDVKGSDTRQFDAFVDDALQQRP
jgi:hypothetical protein